MLSVIMLSAVMLNVFMLSVVMLGAVAPSNICGYCQETLSYYIRMLQASQNLMDQVKNTLFAIFLNHSKNGDGQTQTLDLDIMVPVFCRSAATESQIVNT